MCPPGAPAGAVFSLTGCLPLGQRSGRPEAWSLICVTQPAVCTAVTQPSSHFSMGAGVHAHTLVAAIL